jgi:hypothetical protein
VDFGIAIAAEGLHGRVRFNDLWGSNASGVTVELRDPQNNLALLDTAITGPTGHFEFDSLLPGQYTLRVYAPNGGTPLSRLITAATSGTPYQEVWLPSEGNQPTIIVYADENDNGFADSGEGLPGVSVAFDLGVCGNVIEVSPTDSDGFAPAELVFPDGGCVRVTGGLPEGLSPAQPEGIVISPYDGSIVPLEVVAEGSLNLRPFWDVDGDGTLDINEPLLLDQVTVTPPPELEMFVLDSALILRGPAGSYPLNISPPPTGWVWTPVTTVLPFAAQSTLEIPVYFSNQLNGQVIGPNSGAVSGLTIELRDDENALIAATTTGIAPVDQPGGRSYTPPPAATGGPAAAPFSFDDLAPGTYTARILNLPANMAAAPAEISYDPQFGGNVQLHLHAIDTVSGIVFWDNDYDGRRDMGEPGTQFYDVVLLNNAGLPEQTVTPASDGTFIFTGLQEGVQYALTVPDLYDGTGGSAGNWLTAAPGWFERGTLPAVQIGVGNYASDNPNSLAVGQVYVQNGNARAGVAGATVGYYQLQSPTGWCNAGNPSILGETTTNSEGGYRLPLTYIPGGSVKYCLVVLDAPGLVQNDLTVIAAAAIFYSLPGGQVIYDQALNLNMDIEMRVAVTNLQAATLETGTEVIWSAFRDDNLNGLWDGNEFPLPGVILSNEVLSNTSEMDGSGSIAFAGGRQTLRVSPPEGYAPVGPVTRTLWLTGTPLDLPSMGFVPDDGVHGQLFADKDSDGWLGSRGDEFGLIDVNITVAGPVETTTTTQADGRFTLHNLPDGNYTVSASVPGYIIYETALTVEDGFGIVRLPARSTANLTGALYQDWDGDGLRSADEELATTVPITVTVEGVGSTRPLGGSVLFWDVNPGNYTVQPWWLAADSVRVDLTVSGGGFAIPVVPPGVVRGTLWLDDNRDGARQPWEAPLSGVAVILDGQHSAITDENGRYIFVNVTSGSHQIGANLPDDLSATIPGFTTTVGRGAAVGIPAAVHMQNEFNVYLPLVFSSE